MLYVAFSAAFSNDMNENLIDSFVGLKPSHTGLGICCTSVSILWHPLPAGCLTKKSWPMRSIFLSSVTIGSVTWEQYFTESLAVPSVNRGF